MASHVSRQSLGHQCRGRMQRIANSLRERFAPELDIRVRKRVQRLEVQQLADTLRVSRREVRRGHLRPPGTQLDGQPGNAVGPTPAERRRQLQRTVAQRPTDAASLKLGQYGQEHNLEETIGLVVPEQVELAVHVDHELDQGARSVRLAAAAPDEIAVVVGSGDLDFVQHEADDLPAWRVDGHHRDAVATDVAAQAIEIGATGVRVGQMELGGDGCALVRVEGAMEDL